MVDLIVGTLNDAEREPYGHENGMHRTVFQSGEDQISKLDPARRYKRWEHTYRVGEAKTPGPEYIGLPPGKKYALQAMGNAYTVPWDSLSISQGEA